MKTKITVYSNNGCAEVFATTQEKNKKELLRLHMEDPRVIKITTQNYPLSANATFMHYENPAFAHFFNAESTPKLELTPEPEPTPEPLVEAQVSPPPVGSAVYKPTSLMTPILYMGKNVLTQYTKDFQGNVTCLSKNLSVFGVASSLSSISFQMNNVMHYTFDDERNAGGHFVAIRRIAIDVLLAILYLDGQTDLKRFKDEQSARAVIDYLDRGFIEGGELAIRHVQMTNEKGGVHALTALLSIQVDQLTRLYMQFGSGKDLAYDTRHYLNHPQAIVLRDKLIDLLETILLVMYVFFSLRNQPKKEA